MFCGGKFWVSLLIPGEILRNKKMYSAYDKKYLKNVINMTTINLSMYFRNFMYLIYIFFHIYRCFYIFSTKRYVFFFILLKFMAHIFSKIQKDLTHCF